MKKRLLVVAIPTRPSSSSLDPLLSAAVPPSPPNRGGRERGGPRQGRPRGHRRRRPGTPRSRSCSPGRSPTRCDNIGGACGDGSAAAGAYRPGHHGLGQGASQGPEICGRFLDMNGKRFAWQDEERFRNRTMFDIL
ncbi:hypothetical protein E2562_009719 [Oryza meyeriana var. granulata]|uniref:Uncharacterized protein n=1 Tax=Oryza meyeriana var. granulata TaxID=110450 RepID=A0A6G1D2K5_9ORYZ|nr:hypothetical protein E2562_009719 [Oryza meyeriana var. granulata]KAF0906359.1 hypothetical protein E2562_009719 [Oryza meyeriana var. granulata]KAF0906360.1 hypothetical protein E2562_009719 [Oryza meyeriana var. granulata]KAF0906361.1 hypothetical protein E2562_009719 [Oryza meyeriana var. granulata]KAF0906362.1 hypothetical protein E2562_009719 [Oryza meyeriana var. granulata]